MRYREERPKRRCCEVMFVTYALRGFWRNSQCKKKKDSVAKECWELLMRKGIGTRCGEMVVLLND